MQAKHCIAQSTCHHYSSILIEMPLSDATHQMISHVYCIVHMHILTVSLSSMLCHIDVVKVWCISLLIDTYTRPLHAIHMQLYAHCVLSTLVVSHRNEAWVYPIRYCNHACNLLYTRANSRQYQFERTPHSGWALSSLMYHTRACSYLPLCTHSV
jgi:hypothetical protein